MNRARPLGLGLDFSWAPPDLAGNPDFQQSWAKVQAQLQAEGVDPNSFVGADQVFGAQQKFTDAFVNLAKAGVQDAIGDHAAQYALIGHTAAGALTTIEGLIASVQSGSPLEIAQSFTGTLIAAAVAFGVVSAGIGAAIVGAVGAVLGLIQSLGGTSNPPGKEIQPGCFTGDFPPDFNVGYLLFQVTGGSPRVEPTSKQWRRFPEPSTHPGWFVIPAGGLNGGLNNDSYADGVFYPCISKDANNPANNWRAVDLAFPEYRYLECEQALLLSSAWYQGQPALVGFMQAFFAAWKANQEYALNGITPQPTAQVLLHTLRLWNNGHDSSSTIPLVSANSLLPTFESANCPADLIPSINYYVQAAKDASPEAALLTPDGQSLLLHTGPPKTTMRIALQSGANLAPASGSQPASKAATAAKGVAIVGGGALLTAFLVAQLKGWTMAHLFDKTWAAVRSSVKKAYRAA